MVARYRRVVFWDAGVVADMVEFSRVADVRGVSLRRIAADTARVVGDGVRDARVPVAAFNSSI